MESNSEEIKRLKDIIASKELLIRKLNGVVLHLSHQVHSVTTLTQDVVNLLNFTEPQTHEWEPDGKTIAPSAEAFMAWAKGKKITVSYNNSWYFEAHSADEDGSVEGATYAGSQRMQDSTLAWADPAWREYKPV